MACVYFFDNVVEVEGHPVASPSGFEFLSLFVHKSGDLTKRPKSGMALVVYEIKKLKRVTIEEKWCVSDLHTGGRVSPLCNSSQEAVACIELPSREDFDLIIEVKGDLLKEVV